MICANQAPNGAWHDPPADGYNPLGLCARCLRKYRETGGIERPIGDGQAAPALGVRQCPNACAGRCVAARERVKNSDRFIELPAPGQCLLLTGPFPLRSPTIRHGRAA